MAFMKWAATAAAAAGMVALVSGCGGGGDDSSNADIRLVNASVGYASLDLTADTKSVNSAVAYGTTGSYASVASGASVQVLAGGTTIAASTATLTGGSKYSLIAYGWAGAARTTLLQEAQTAPAAGSTMLNVMNLAAIDTGPVDTYLTADCTSSLEGATPIGVNTGANNLPSSSGYNTTTAGTYCIRVTGFSNKTDLRLTLPGIALPSLQIANLILTSSNGGVLVNAMMLVQGAGVTNYPGTSARARVIGAISGGTRVAATRAGVELMPNSLGPVAGGYVTVPSGNAAVNVTINSAATPITLSPAMAAGGDYTLLVWGTAAAPQVVVLTDDNRLPLSASQTKLRLINGVSNLEGGLTLSVDFGVVANNIQPGAASTYGSVNASTAAALTVTSPGYLDPIYPIFTPGTQQPTVPLVAGGVYDMIMMGDGTSTTTLRSALRKVR